MINNKYYIIYIFARKMDGHEWQYFVVGFSCMLFIIVLYFRLSRQQRVTKLRGEKNKMTT